MSRINMLVKRVTDHFPATKHRQEEAEQTAEHKQTTRRREKEADAVIRSSYALAERLSQHRDENHFAQRIRAVYRGGTRE